MPDQGRRQNVSRPWLIEYAVDRPTWNHAAGTWHQWSPDRYSTADRAIDRALTYRGDRYYAQRADHWRVRNRHTDEIIAIPEPKDSR